jgi:hypothetical protein
MILSSRCRDRTSIVFGSFLLPARPATIPDHAAHASVTTTEFGMVRRLYHERC